MIVGVGLDLTEIPRIAAMMQRWGERFTRKIFTDGERSYAAGRARPADHLAARVSAKEATLKALGVPSGLSWHDMEVVKRRGARPELVLTGRALEASVAMGISRVHLTITHAADVACAVVVAEAG